MAKANSAAKPARNVASFRAVHDRSVVIPNKIRDTLAKMAQDHGSEHYEYESDFIKLAGVHSGDLNAHRDSFADHIVEAKPIGFGNARAARRVWFATVKAAKAARGE
jgi:hypothetical protein